MPETAGTDAVPARKGAAKLDPGKLGDVLAGKGQALGAPVGAEQRGGSIPPSATLPVSTTPEPAPAKRKGPKGISTSLESTALPDGQHRRVPAGKRRLQHADPAFHGTHKVRHSRQAGRSGAPAAASVAVGPGLLMPSLIPVPLRRPSRAFDVWN